MENCAVAYTLSMLTVGSEITYDTSANSTETNSYYHDRTPQPLSRREFCIYTTMAGLTIAVNGLSLAKETADLATEAL